MTWLAPALIAQADSASPDALINWITVVAQVVNFLILVLLLRYFLYGRIVAAMEKRQQGIESRWEEAEAHRAETAQELEAARQQRQQLEELRQQALSEIRDEAEAYRKELRAGVRSDIDQLRGRWAGALREESDSFLRDLRRRAVEQACGIARRALSDLADAELEEQVVRVFLARIQTLDEQRRQPLIRSLSEGQRSALVETGFELSPELRQSITSALRHYLLPDLAVQFEPSPDAICGIALRTNGHKLAWEMREYLASLEEEMARALEEEARVNEARTVHSELATGGA